jgi:hypothetical protein
VLAAVNAIRMSKEEIVQLFDEFINENGMLYAFKEWLQERGYSLQEVGLKDD